MKVFLHRAYRSVYSVIPTPLRKAISVLDYTFLSKPQIDSSSLLDPLQKPAHGVVVISFDFELAWSWQYSKNVTDFISMGLHEREQVPKILSVMNEFIVPATWATVGHLFLSECKRNPDGLAHSHMPRAAFFESNHCRYSTGDWYQNDPCSNIDRDPAWYAPDLIEQILDAPARNELASHSFSHLGFGPTCSKEAALAEITECRKVMEAFGVRPVTWIFPDHQNGHYDLLAKNGISIVRTSGDEKAVLTLPRRNESGLWVLETSSMLERGRDWSVERRIAWLKKLVLFAEHHHLVAHVWLHPSITDQNLENVFVPFIRFLAERRDAGHLEIKTMAQLVSMIDGNPLSDRIRNSENPM